MESKEILKEVFDTVKNELKKIGVPVSESICPNIRLSSAKRNWGSCKKTSKGNYRFYISISENCFKEPDSIGFIKNVMAHELIHTAEGCFNHGERFKLYSKKAKKAGYDVSVSKKSDVIKSEEELYAEAKHILKCVDCGQLYYRFRFPKEKNYINKIRCGKCKGKLIKIK